MIDIKLMHSSPIWEDELMIIQPHLEVGFITESDEKVSISSHNGRLMFCIEKEDDINTFISVEKEHVPKLIEGIEFILKHNIFDDTNHKI